MSKLPFTVLTQLGRRQFLSGASAAISLAGTSASLRSVSGQDINSSIQVGVIGLGSRGFNLVDDLLREEDSRIVAVCDVDRRHYRDQLWGKGRLYGREVGAEKVATAYGVSTKQIDQYNDYRELCARDDIDAIVVATPDHWHALCTVEALRHGKDVYCEKPVTHTFREGIVVCEEVAKQEAVFQTGSQQRSDPRFRRAVEIVRGGHLGRIERVEVGLPPGYAGPQGDATIAAPPEGLDYELWCGPAPKLPYRRATHHRWWRGNRAFGGGVLMDWIGHHNDIAQWGIGEERGGPTQVESVGWKYPDTDVYDSPHQYEISCTYRNGVTTSIASRHAVGVRWVGTDGWLFVTRGKWNASNPRWLQDKFDPGVSVYESPGHMRNFLDCIRSRRECVAPAEIAHRSITPGHLGYVSDQLQRPLKWDASRQVIVDDEEANKLLLKLSYRDSYPKLTA